MLVERIDPERGVSGALPIDQRADLQLLRQLTEARAHDELRVYAVDRLTRSKDPQERLLTRLRAIASKFKANR